MEWPTDLADRVSPALARVVRHVLDDPDRSTEATLGVTRAALSRGLVRRMIEAKELDEHDRRAVVQELDALIAELGEDIPLVHLLRYRAPGPLSTVIEEVLARQGDQETPVTLAHVREAIAGDLIPGLVGQGLIDPEEDDAIGEQLEDLIRVHGERALAEELTGAEDETP